MGMREIHDRIKSLTACRKKPFSYCMPGFAFLGDFFGLIHSSRDENTTFVLISDSSVWLLNRQLNFYMFPK